MTITFFGGPFQNLHISFHFVTLLVKRCLCRTTPSVLRQSVWAVPISLAATHGILI